MELYLQVDWQMGRGWARAGPGLGRLDRKVLGSLNHSVNQFGLVLSDLGDPTLAQPWPNPDPFASLALEVRNWLRRAAG